MNPQLVRLDYLTEYPLGRIEERKTRPAARLIERASRKNPTDEHFSKLAWYLARKLEARENAPLHEGVWPISNLRCWRRWGDPGIRLFPHGSSIDTISEEVRIAAQSRRTLFYFRVLDAEMTKQLLHHPMQVTLACEITEDWYDPNDGYIDDNPSYPKIVGAHSVALISHDAKPDRFIFLNSWGPEWGKNGSGALSRAHFDRFATECWCSFGNGMRVPYAAKSGLICLEWKWSLHNIMSIHCCEIVDASRDECLAWAFCVRRDSSLDVDEFFVWPSERNKGLATALSKMIVHLAGTMSVPIRLFVPYADTEGAGMAATSAVARMLNVNLFDSPLRCIHKLGQADSIEEVKEVAIPPRPANMLEWLRPKDESPLNESTEYPVLFGTNRKQENTDDDQVSFGNTRGSELVLGKVNVVIPNTYRFGSKGRWWRQIIDKLRGKVPKIRENATFPNERIFAKYAREIAAQFGTAQHNLLFVHGFNTSFNDAAKQAAQFAADLKVPGNTFLFSWPSFAKFTAYAADEATVDASVLFFRQFVEFIVREFPSVPLSVIAHSMGNRIATRFIESLSIPANGRRLFNQLIFAAPDVDQDVFKTAATVVPQVATRGTLYATNGDYALWLSQTIHKYARAGLAPPVLVVDGIDTVLVEDFDLFKLGHNYHATASSILHDMFNLIHYDSDPAMRPAIVAAKTEAGLPFWKLRLT